MIIVGPAGTQTTHNRAVASSIAKTARLFTSNVVVVGTPHATWSAVRSAVSGAAVVIYLGRGRGFPSPYSRLLSIATEDGLGLNAAANKGNSNVKFYGERSVRALALSPNALVLLLSVPYAAGAGEPGAVQPSVSTARARADNYAAGFLAAGASAVIGDSPASASYYLRAVFTGSTTLDKVWRASPTRNGHVGVFRSTRTVRSVGRLDPETTRSGFDRSIVGRVGVAISVVRAGVSATPPPTPPYGSAINADDLNNSVVGGPDGRMVSYRFRATESSGLQAIRVYLAAGSGYSGGTNGSLNITVQTDDGSSAHRPSGAVLAATSYTPGPSLANSGIVAIAFSSPAQLVAGQLYHVVFANGDASPTRNYVSVDGLFTFDNPSPWQPKHANTDWANLIYFKGAWSDNRGAGQGVITPVMALYYTDGAVVGQGYLEVWVSLPKKISGNDRVREAFTVRGASQTVNTASVRVRRLSGTSPLTIRLETSSGAVVATGTVAAGLIPSGSHPGWATAVFASSVQLTSGSAYHLVLESSSDTSYDAFVIRDGAHWGFPASTYFADGTAQYTTGAGWLGFDQPGGGTNLTMGDLQFYLQQQ